MKILYNNESFYKEIEIVQSCITRMAHNSFMIKGWLLSIIAGVFALLPEEFDGKAVIVMLLLLTISFWYLDGYFLHMERLYRQKYSWIIENRRIDNFEYAFDLNPHNESMWLAGVQKGNILKVITSKTLLVFYGPLFVIVILIFIFY